MNRTAQPSLLSVHDANGTPLARLGNLSPLSFHPTLVPRGTRLSRPATPCGALPLVRLCIICGAVGCQVAVTYSPFSVADGPRRVPRAVSEFPEIHVSVALSSGIMPMFVEGAGFEPAMSYAFFAAYPRHYLFSGYSSVAFDHSAILPLTREPHGGRA